jgi:hypothetical protein
MNFLKTRWLISPKIQLVGWILVGGILLYLALDHLETRVVWETFGKTNGWYVALAILSVGITTYAKAVRWKILLMSSGRRVGVGSVLVPLMIGQTMNWYLPGRVGDVGRVMILGKTGLGKTFALGTVALEKILDLVAYIILFFVTLILIPLPQLVSEAVYSMAVVTLALVIGLGIVVSNPARFIRWIYKLLSIFPDRITNIFRPRLLAAMDSLEIFRDPKELLWVAFWTLLIWGTSIWTNSLVGLALGKPLSILASLAVLVILFAGVSVPSIPGRIGIFQYVCILALGLFKISAEFGLSYGILLQAVVFLPTTLLSLIFLGLFGIKVTKDDELGKSLIK